MHRKSVIVALALILAACLPAIAEGMVDARIETGKQAFDAERYREALDAFGSVLADPKALAARPEATYWSILCYLALGDQAAAEKAVDAYLSTYPDGPRVPDLLYQRGRILYAKSSYEEALKTFSAFIAASPEHSLVPSALYWGGECLYSLGRLDDADKVFSLLLERYPTSVKVEAATYRRELIKLEYRESELLRLLTWSHEEALRAAEDFRERERNYEQALSAYQKQLAGASGAAGQSQDKARIDELSARLAKAQADLDAARAALAKAQAAAGQASSVPVPATVTPPASIEGDGTLLAEALEAKRRALDLLAAYLEKLQEGAAR